MSKLLPDTHKTTKMFLSSVSIQQVQFMCQAEVKILAALCNNQGKTSSFTDEWKEQCDLH